MTDIYSRMEPERLLFRHITFAELGTKLKDGLDRSDYCDPCEFIQVAAIRTGDDRHDFQAHLHIDNERSIERTQEVWIVMTGSVSVELYDVNGSLMYESLDLGTGDVFITFAGGHEYSMAENSLVVEVKPGPYLGRDADKVSIHV